MSDPNNAGEKTLSVSGTKTLSLKRPTEQGTVRQSFSHGRTKQVVVEKVKTRVIAPGKPPAKDPAPPAPAPATTAAPRPAAPVAPTQPSSAPSAAAVGGARPVLSPAEAAKRSAALANPLPPRPIAPLPPAPTARADAAPQPPVPAAEPVAPAPAPVPVVAAEPEPAPVAVAPAPPASRSGPCRHLLRRHPLPLLRLQHLRWRAQRPLRLWRRVRPLLRPARQLRQRQHGRLSWPVPGRNLHLPQHVLCRRPQEPRPARPRPARRLAPPRREPAWCCAR